MSEDNVASRLEGVRWIDLPSNHDPRGVLTSIESGMDIPFEIRRIFYMHHVLTDRGGHAHTETDQVVIAASGSFKMDLTDESLATRTYEMNGATRGLYIPRMIFIRIYEISAEAVCLVLANTHYNMSKSIRNWEDFLELTQNRSGRTA